MPIDASWLGAEAKTRKVKEANQSVTNLCLTIIRLRSSACYLFDVSPGYLGERQKTLSSLLFSLPPVNCLAHICPI